MAFYNFARAADDVADDGSLSVEEKLAILNAMAAQLHNGADAPDMHVRDLVSSLAVSGVTSQHAQNLLKAFMWDAHHPRTADWAALMAYCDLSAAPVGRYLIDLLGGCEGGYRSSDALCTALQVLNHIQDIKDDRHTLDRVYVPSDWMVDSAISETDLDASECSPALRKVINRMLDGVDGLLDEAAPLAKTIHSRALAREASGILAIARKLSQRLRLRDPLAGRVALSKPAMAVHFAWGALRA